jgi:endoglucanase
MFKKGLSVIFFVAAFMFMACSPGNNNDDDDDDSRPGEEEAMAAKSALQYFIDEGIKAGWNLGNTLDAVEHINSTTMGSAVETAWGNPKASQALLNGVKAQGFDIVRIPCSWKGHIGPAPDYKVSEARLARVAEVVNMAHKAGMKAIINIHHDGNYQQPDTIGTWGFVKFGEVVRGQASSEQVKDELGKVWTQIAEYFKNYGDYLIFETLNEVHSGNWGGNYNPGYAGYSYENEQNLLFDWNQTALNAIRATGGNNATRYVAVPGLGSTEPDIVLAAHARKKLLPNDGANGTDKLIVAVHFYAPSAYTVAEVAPTNPGDTKLKHTLTPEELADIDTEAGHLKETFYDNGIAVYYGEWGAPTNVRSSMDDTVKNTHTDYIGRVAKAARENGIIPIYWDDGGDFKVLERSDGKPKAGLWKATLDAMINAIASAVPPAPPAGSNGTTAVWESYDAFADGIGSAATITLSNNEYTISGNKVTDGYAGAFLIPNTATLTIMKTMKSFTFMASGDGKSYDVMIPTVESAENGDNHYRSTFTASASPALITVNVPAGLAQANWGGTGIVEFVQANVQNIQFQLAGTGSFNLKVWDIKLNQ